MSAKSPPRTLFAVVCLSSQEKKKREQERLQAIKEERRKAKEVGNNKCKNNINTQDFQLLNITKTRTTPHYLLRKVTHACMYARLCVQTCLSIPTHQRKKQKRLEEKKRKAAEKQKAKEELEAKKKKQQEARRDSPSSISS